MKQTGNRKIGTLEVILAMILAGSSVVVGKYLTLRLPLFLTAFLSLGTAFLFMLPFQLTRIKEPFSLKPGEWKYIFLQALFGIVLFRILTLYGLRYTSALQAGLITSTTPGVMILLSRLILKEKTPPRRLWAMVMVMGGVGLINLLETGPGQEGFTDSLKGVLLLSGAVVSESLLTIFRKSAPRKITALTNTTLLVLISLLLFFPLALTELPEAGISLREWVCIIYYGIGATAIAYILWGDGSVRVPAGITGLATGAIPLSAMVLSCLFLKEQPDFFHITGGLVVCLGFATGFRGKD